MTLSPLKKDYINIERIKYPGVVYDPDPEDYDYDKYPGRYSDGREDHDDYDQRRADWEENFRVIVQPEPEEFKVPEAVEATFSNSVDLVRDYGNRGLQIIVKLANIHLTPENPTYEGGTWHVEGQQVSIGLRHSD